jgi:t-SNARE complex subunit (syntaxin)
LIEIDEDAEKDDQKIGEFQAHMSQRTEQVGNVAKSIGKIQDMFKSLNEIVSQQG